RMTCDLNTLWQQFRRGARDASLTAHAILLVEARYFDDEKEKAIAHVEEKDRKGKENIAPGHSNSKRKANESASGMQHVKRP
ncbi:uncharacterized protein LAESUDRAFT_653165, partial [Laetiporus sulphureus 93-53]